jgi:peptidoglycan/xylan/chitin deacetylase (PgdA/CDA1 family)
MSAWPNGHHVGVVLNVMLEQWDDEKSPGLGPMGNPLSGAATDFQARSWAQYGPRTGAEEIRKLLKAHSMPSTFYVSGILAQRNPQLVAALAGDGHEIAGHGWSQDIIPATLPREVERDQMARCVHALTAATGERPLGWISPRCTPSSSTAALLAESGFTWFGDVFDADDPYVIDTPEGSIVGLPFGLEINDLPAMVRYGQPARELVNAFEDALDAARAQQTRSYIDVTVHAHVAGRPVGRRQLELILTRVAAEGLWVGTRLQIAEQFLASKQLADASSDANRS